MAKGVVKKTGSARSRRKPPIIVGVGASAGGLEALQRLFDKIKLGQNIAFVVVQHLAPDHKSLMVELLAKHTSLKVVAAEDGAEVVKDTIYLLPPARTITIQENTLQLAPREQAGVMLPIDIFFESLARDQGARAIVMIMSGTGTDGTRGIVAIKQAGGTVIVQDPASAKFDGMPRSAIATRMVDDIAPPETMGESLLALSKNAKPRSLTGTGDGGTDGDILPPPRANAMGEVMAALRRETDVDFTHYKQTTLLRRIDRRMHAKQVEDLAGYASLLRETPSEVLELYKELLIGVTKFFRDSEAFALIRERIVPELVARSTAQVPIRVWVCGCASGEEAYSLAIAFCEEIERTGRMVEVKVFATDIDRESIDTASLGFYEESITKGLTQEQLDTYFVRRGNGYAVTRHLRQMVVFARHNVLKDPPFTKLDLVSCRNMLIYLEPVWQRKVLSRFHYALKANGYMFLGSSETLGGLADSFRIIDAKQKIFQVAQKERGLPPDLLSLAGPTVVSPRERRPVHSAMPEEAAIDQGMSILLASFAPPALLINENHEMMHVFGAASRFLEVPQGVATLDVLKMLPSPIAGLAGSAVNRAFRMGVDVPCHPVAITIHGVTMNVRLRVRPFTEKSGRRYALVLFEQDEDRLHGGVGGITSIGGGGGSGVSAPLDLNAEAEERIRGLESDLRSSRESLQATVEELETSNEELQAANEELLASNEELQSTNEELQSVNEELYTVNAEYQSKIEELMHLTDDLDNLFKATEVAVMFLDPSMVIRRFTPAVMSVINVMDRDVGRPIADISINLDYPEFHVILGDVMASGQAITNVVRTRDGRWMQCRILPYTSGQTMGEANRVYGVIVTFFDITALKETEQRLHAVLNSLSDVVLVLDSDGIIVQANGPWKPFMMKLLASDAAPFGVGDNYIALCATLMGDNEGQAKALHTILQQVSLGQATLQPLVFHRVIDGQDRRFEVSAALVDGGGPAIVVTYRDVTERNALVEIADAGAM